MTTLISFSVTKKANKAERKGCYLALVTPSSDGLDYRFVDGQKHKNTIGFVATGIAGDVLRYRYRAWNGERMATTDGWLVINGDDTVTPLTHDEAERVLVHKALAAPAANGLPEMPAARRLAPDFIRVANAEDVARDRAKAEAAEMERIYSLPAPAMVHVFHARFGEGIVTLDHPANPWVRVKFDKQKKELRMAREALQWI